MYDSQVCSIARALEVVGDRWTLLILRDTAFRARRFDDLQGSLGLARNVLTERLQRLCDDGLLERQLYQERPARYEYAQTQKGRDLFPVLAALIQWGDKYRAPNGPPRVIRHRGCGGAVVLKSCCATCGAQLTFDDIENQPGPGAATSTTPGADIAGRVASSNRHRGSNRRAPAKSTATR
jgi:DNA-binding HxlR family transcriptional regulator